MIDRAKLLAFLTTGKTSGEVAVRFGLSRRRARQLLVEMTNEMLVTREWDYAVCKDRVHHGRYVYRRLTPDESKLLINIL